MIKVVIKKIGKLLLNNFYFIRLIYRKRRERGQTIHYSSTFKKYLLCEPCGGLNDIFCQIEACWNYAEKYGRILIVDTNHSSSSLFDNFSNYFDIKISNKNVFLELDDDLSHKIKDLTIFPEKIKDISHKSIRGTSDKKTNISITFDFKKRYEESLLLHHQCGGGEISINLLERLMLRKNVAENILGKIKLLPENYIGIHIRNTDLKTDYRLFFSHIYKKVLHQNILICSDDYQCIEFAKYFFKNSNVLTLSDISDNKGNPIHIDSKDTEDKTRDNIDTLTDLIGLSMSTKIFYEKVKDKEGKKYYSGFSMLSKNLQKRKEVINDLFLGSKF